VNYEKWIIYYINRTDYPSGSSLKETVCGAFCLISLACGAFCLPKKYCRRRIYFLQNLECGPFHVIVLFFLQAQWYGKYLECNYSVITTTQFVPKTIMKQSSNRKPFVKSILIRYKSQNTTSIAKQFTRNNVREHREIILFIGKPKGRSRMM